MKKIYLCCLALLCSAGAWADNGFSIGDFTIEAGQEKTIDVVMTNDQNIAAFQFVIALPDGVDVTKVTATNRLKKYDEDEEGYVPVHTLVGQKQSTGNYKVMAYAVPSTDITGNTGAVVKLKFKASDQISTKTFNLAITDQEMTEKNGTKHKIDDATYNCTVTLSTTVTTLGYASFSWPKALDFTNSGLTAYIATSYANNSLHLESVTKVPANTGLILKGTAGSENTYPLETTDDETLDDVNGNMLTSNTTGIYTVSTNNVYVLSNLDNGMPGFYIADNGVNIGQYKSFLVLSEDPTRKGLAFDEVPAGILTVGTADAASYKWYDLQGRRVQQPTKGVYVVNGTKRIVK